MQSNSKLIIVGASGYIGRFLYNKIKSESLVYGTSSSGKNGLLPLCLQAPGDFDYGRIGSGDVVLLTAALSEPDVCAREYDRAWSVNVTGTTAFIDSALQRGARVVFFSSDTVYGEREDDFDETAPCNPAGEYAKMKREVEERFSRSALFKSVRLSYVFSREDRYTRYLEECARKNEEAELFHPFFRAIVHRDDVVEGVLALAARWTEVPEQVINFGGSRVLSRIDFAECLRKVHLPSLCFKATDPGADFFRNRPRIIAMKSPIFSRLLGRPPRGLSEAACLEYKAFINTEQRR